MGGKAVGSFWLQLTLRQKEVEEIQDLQTFKDDLPRVYLVIDLHSEVFGDLRRLKVTNMATTSLNKDSWQEVGDKVGNICLRMACTVSRAATTSARTGIRLRGCLQLFPLGKDDPVNQQQTALPPAFKLTDVEMKLLSADTQWGRSFVPPYLWAQAAGGGAASRPWPAATQLRATMPKVISAEVLPNSSNNTVSLLRSTCPEIFQSVEELTVTRPKLQWLEVPIQPVEQGRTIGGSE